MSSRQSFLRTALAAGVVVLSVAGCGQMRPSEKIDIYEATLTGAQEVPANPSTGRGQAEVQLNHNTMKLTWKVTYGGLAATPTMGHIHGPAAVTANAGVLVPFQRDIVAQPLQGEAVVTPAQAADLAAGLWYVNIHSTQYPAGEIRGQLRRRQ